MDLVQAATKHWFIQDDNGAVGVHYLHSGRAVPFGSQQSAERAISEYGLDHGIYSATDVEPEPWPV